MTNFQSILLLMAMCVVPMVLPEAFNQYPQGYYPFEESPAKIPPKVRKPPYLQTQVNCPGVAASLTGDNEQTLDNLCGDLNKGYLPLNPIGQNVEGVSYPFELFKAKTLEFFSKTLPILKADDTLPKVARYEDNHIAQNPTLFNSKPGSRITFYHHRTSRSAPGDLSGGLSGGLGSLLDKNEKKVEEGMSGLNEADKEAIDNDPSSRQARGFCKDSYGVFCMLYNALAGSKEGEGKADDRMGGDGDIPSISAMNSLDSPMTPCPSAVEYVTPVFAKNYQGVWRYVVQIPYEGYFTQTVEVVKCLSTKCEYLDGSCLASPRWVSLLVAEIYYPDATFPNPAPTGQQPPQNRNPVQAANPPSDYNQFFLKRSGNPGGPTTSPETCDGQDELGCYQVRLYYDWFLIPGSCKCWKNDFFDQYTKKR